MHHKIKKEKKGIKGKRGRKIGQGKIYLKNKACMIIDHTKSKFSLCFMHMYMKLFCFMIVLYTGDFMKKVPSATCVHQG